MAKVLLVDTNFSSGPIYAALLDRGHEVHVVGNNPNDFLAKTCHTYWSLDYSDTAVLESLIARERYSYIVPGCTDRSYLSCVAVSRGRFPGLDGAPACQAIFDKAHYRETTQRLDLPAPRVLEPNQLPDKWPVVVKPVDAFSGKGITVLREKDQSAFAAAIAKARNASMRAGYLVEEFAEGQLYSHSAFLHSGKICADFVVQEDSSANPFVVDTSRLYANVPAKLLVSLRRCVERIAADLTLADGLLHSQFVWNGHELWLIETTRRCPGDLYSQLIELATGYPYAQSYIAPFLGERIEATAGKLRKEPIMRHTISLSHAQDFGFLRFRVPVHIVRWTALALAGDPLQPSPQGRIAVLFCRASDDDDLNRIYRLALSRALYEVQA